MMKKLLGLLLLAGLLFFAWHWFAKPPQSPQAPAAAAGPPQMPALPVKVSQAKQEDVSSKVEAVGSLLAGESVVLRPEITGRVSAIRFQEGARVRAGEVLVELNADEQRSALAQSQAALQMEQQSFGRIRDMRAKNLASQQQYDESLARLQNAQALLERDKVRLSRTSLAAPFDGILGLRQISLGDYVSPGQPLVNLESIDPVKMDFQLPEKYAGLVAKGLRVDVGVDAWPGRLFRGEIQAVDPKLDEATRTVRARARLPNADLALKPGMFAHVILDLGRIRQGLFVPEQALEAKGSTSTVFRVVDGRAVLTVVKTGERRTGFVEITEGIKPQDWVVTDGQLKLRDGMSVSAINKAAP